MLLSSQAGVRQFLFQCTQIAVLLTQGCHVARPRLTLAELLIQGTHLYQIGAGELVALTVAHRNQSFGKLPVELDRCMRSGLFGGPGDLEGDIAVSIIAVAITVGVAVPILLCSPLKSLQGLVDVAFVLGGKDRS